jgi:hypothetical protein
VQQQAQTVVGEVAEALADPLTFLMSRFTASVGPLEQLLVEWKARTSASQALTVRASRDSSATPTLSARALMCRRISLDSLRTQHLTGGSGGDGAALRGRGRDRSA